VNRLEVLSLVGLGLVLMALYFFVFRPEWEGSSGTAVMVEWLVLMILIGIFMAIAYLYLRRKGRPEELGNWGRLVQSVVRDRGDAEEVRKAMDEFVQYGRKEALLVHITTALKAGGLEDVKIALCIRELANHSGNEDELYPIWARGEYTASVQQERNELIRRTLDMAQRMLGNGPQGRGMEGNKR